MLTHSTTQSQFTGPIFVVGMVRSGTKMLRGLLNRSSKIGIPVTESHFIPYLVKQFEDPRCFEDPDQFAELYNKLRQTNFFVYLQDRGRELSWDKFCEIEDRTSWPEIVSHVFRFYAPEGRDEDFIWGDKTPSYLRHMNLLKEVFPDAKFIHIIRDPRDYCLSVKKSWGKSIYRAANQWRETMQSGQAAGRKLGDDYIEVSYEALLDDPAEQMQRLCEFIGCEYSDSMTHLETAQENLGDATGETRIVRENQNKYREQLSAVEIRRIEELVYPVAEANGYTLEQASRFRPMTALTSAALATHDAASSVRRYIADKGVGKGLRYFWRQHRHQGSFNFVMNRMRGR